MDWDEMEDGRTGLMEGRTGMDGGWMDWEEDERWVDWEGEGWGGGEALAKSLNWSPEFGIPDALREHLEAVCCCQPRRPCTGAVPE